MFVECRSPTRDGRSDIFAQIAESSIAPPGTRSRAGCCVKRLTNCHSDKNDQEHTLITVSGDGARRPSEEAGEHREGI
jgi:hypothetical protein